MSSAEEFLSSKYPAKYHAKRVTDWIIDHGGSKDGLLYLEAQKLRYNEVSLHCLSSDLITGRN